MPSPVGHALAGVAAAWLTGGRLPHGCTGRSFCRSHAKPAPSSISRAEAKIVLFGAAGNRSRSRSAVRHPQHLHAQHRRRAHRVRVDDGGRRRAALARRVRRRRPRGAATSCSIGWAATRHRRSASWRCGRSTAATTSRRCRSSMRSRDATGSLSNSSSGISERPSRKSLILGPLFVAAYLWRRTLRSHEVSPGHLTRETPATRQHVTYSGVVVDALGPSSVRAARRRRSGGGGDTRGTSGRRGRHGAHPGSRRRRRGR